MPINPTQEPTMTTTTTKATTSTITIAATPTTPNDIKKAFGKALRRKNLGGEGEGDSEGSGGGGEGGRGEGAAPQQQMILPGQDEQIMGQLPSVFDGDRTKAKAFIEEVKSYMCLNIGVNGFYSPMKKMAFILTLIKGNDVQG